MSALYREDVPGLFDEIELPDEIHLPAQLPDTGTPRHRLFYDFTVYGVPGPQGSKRAFVNKKTGTVQLVESSAKVKPWRADVAAAAEDARSLVLSVLDCCTVVDMVFTFMRPKGHYRTGRNAHLLRDNVPARPKGKPDLSKLARSTEDALTHILWRDDAQVVEYGRLAKVYAGEDPDALDRPGARIRIYSLGAAS